MTWKLIWPVILLALLPVAVSLLYYGHLPAGFGVFPPQLITANPPFLWWYFGIVLVIALAVVALYLRPSLFGFKGITPQPPAAAAKFPWWGWAGAVVTLFFWYLMWVRVTPFGDLVYYAFSPLWWGFIFVLDGIVYKRNGGVSLASSKPTLLCISAIVSLFGWLFFEFFDYFVNENWYYPQADILPHKITVAVYLIAYTTVWPAVFQWYNLINTFPKFVARYQDGPKVNLKGSWLLAAGFIAMVLMVILPLPMFWMVWIGPFAVFSGILVLLNIDNPITSMAKGNWSPALVIALACFLNGFVWEMWNYGSALDTSIAATNPNYWKYNIPYVYVPRILSEMPVLGYFGYMPFGVLCWQFLIWAGKLFKFDSDITVTPSGKL